MPISNDYIIALDVGERRIGVAIASKHARLARPLQVLINNKDTWAHLKQLLAREGADTVVVGLPRNLTSQDTAQTAYARDFACQLQEIGGFKVILQDEALTSKQAEAELKTRGRDYSKGDVDTLAAVYILEDYLASIDSMEVAN